MGKNFIMRKLFTFFFMYYLDDQKEEDEMGRTCSTHGGDKYKILIGKPE
jgi:hypothetical protein